MKTSWEIQLIIEYKWCIYFSYTIFSLLFSHFLLFCSLPCSFSTLLNDNNIERTNHTVVFCYYSFTLHTTWIYRYNFIVLKSIQFRCDIHFMYAFFLFGIHFRKRRRQRRSDRKVNFASLSMYIIYRHMHTFIYSQHTPFNWLKLSEVWMWCKI